MNRFSSLFFFLLAAAVCLAQGSAERFALQELSDDISVSLAKHSQASFAPETGGQEQMVEGKKAFAEAHLGERDNQDTWKQLAFSVSHSTRPELSHNYRSRAPPSFA